MSCFQWGYKNLTNRVAMLHFYFSIVAQSNKLTSKGASSKHSFSRQYNACFVFCFENIFSVPVIFVFGSKSKVDLWVVRDYVVDRFETDSWIWMGIECGNYDNLVKGLLHIRHWLCHLMWSQVHNCYVFTYARCSKQMLHFGRISEFKLIPRAITLVIVQ